MGKRRRVQHLGGELELPWRQLGAAVCWVLTQQVDTLGHSTGHVVQRMGLGEGLQRSEGEGNTGHVRRMGWSSSPGHVLGPDKGHVLGQGRGHVQGQGRDHDEGGHGRDTAGADCGRKVQGQHYKDRGGGWQEAVLHIPRDCCGAGRGIALLGVHGAELDGMEHVRTAAHVHTALVLGAVSVVCTSLLAADTVTS